MHKCTHAHTYIQRLGALRSQRSASDPLELVLQSSKLPNVGAGNQIQVLCKPLSHSPAPKSYTEMLYNCTRRIHNYEKKHIQELVVRWNLLSSLFSSVLCQGPHSSFDDCSYVRHTLGVSSWVISTRISSTLWYETCKPIINVKCF